MLPPPVDQPLLDAIVASDLAEVQRLLAAGSKADSQGVVLDKFSHPTRWGTFHCAVAQGKKEVLLALIGAGAALNGLFEERRPVHEAVWWNRPAALKVLLQN